MLWQLHLELWISNSCYLCLLRWILHFGFPRNYAGIWIRALVHIWFCDDKEDILRFLDSDPCNLWSLLGPSLQCLLFTLALFPLLTCCSPSISAAAAPGLLVWLPVWCSLSAGTDSSLSVSDPVSAWGCGNTCSVAGMISVVSPGSLCGKRRT